MSALPLTVLQLLLLSAVTSSIAAQTPHGKILNWDMNQSGLAWQDAQAEKDKSIIFFIAPSECENTEECNEKLETLAQVADSLAMDKAVQVVSWFLPRGENDIGLVFGPAMKIAHAIVEEPVLVFAIGSLKFATRYFGQWDTDAILEGLMSAKNLGVPLDDTECLINDLDDIAMMALDKDANLDQLITDALWHQEIMDGFELECANIYITTLRRIKDRGQNYVRDEQARLQKLVSSRSTPYSKRQIMQRKLNVLNQFDMGSPDDCEGPMCDREL
jgi:hypothetical protein